MSRFDLVPLAKILLADVSKFSAVPAQLSQAFTNGATSLWYALPSSYPQHTYLTRESF